MRTSQQAQLSERQMQHEQLCRRHQQQQHAAATSSSPPIPTPRAPLQPGAGLWRDLPQRAQRALGRQPAPAPALGPQPLADQRRQQAHLWIPAGRGRGFAHTCWGAEVRVRLIARRLSHNGNLHSSAAC